MSIFRQIIVVIISASYIEHDTDEIRRKPNANECLGLPLANTKDDSRPNSGSSGISSSHSQQDLRKIDENNSSKFTKNIMKRSKSADTRLNAMDGSGGPQEKVKFYIGQNKYDDNNNLPKNTHYCFDFFTVHIFSVRQQS
jgi:hypothetical protein